VPTFFSTLLLLIASLILAVIAGLKRVDCDPFSRHWLVLTLVLLAMATDEAAGFHELLIDPMRHAWNLSGALRFGWVIAGAAFTATYAVLSLRFIASLPAATRSMLVISGAVYVTGALGFEMVDGALYVEEGVPGRNMLPYMLAMTAEETLEMLGIILFVRTLLAYAQARWPLFEVRIC
jgi:hypothetical protein